MEHILSLSYGKDSLACLEACKLLGYPIDRVIHAEVWATDTIPAELSPMVEFKKRADRLIKERYNLTVEHLTATIDKKKLTYESVFYSVYTNGKKVGQIYGFPILRGQWCTSKLKTNVLNKLAKEHLRENVLPEATTQESRKARNNKRFPRSCSSKIAQGANTNTVQYLGIAADEPERIERHSKPGYILPLVDIGWNEAYCRKWCEENDLLSPIYTTATRGGCWFCHNQGVDQLRLLYKDYPELWKLLLKWDWDSPITFKADGHTVHDYNLRFYAEDLGLVPSDRKFRWKLLENPELYKGGI